MYAPVAPFSQAPLMMLIGKITKRVVATEDDKVIIKPMFNLMATIDHRYVDGHEGSKLAKIITRCLENPEILDDPSLLDRTLYQEIKH